MVVFFFPAVVIGVMLSLFDSRRCLPVMEEAASSLLISSSSSSPLILPGTIKVRLLLHDKLNFQNDNYDHQNHHYNNYY